MKMFITSNQQFGRHHAIDSAGRNFVSVDVMDEYMIEQWNSVVGEDDTVYVLGNFAWDPETAENVIKSLNGKIIVMAGVYDGAIREIAERYGKDLGVSIMDEGIKFMKFLQICASHWPLAHWPGKETGVISVVGLHNDEYKTDHKVQRINVAADYWDFKPVDITEVIKLFKDPDLK